MSSFENLSNELNSHSIDLHAAELHGMLVGYACGAKDVPDINRLALYENWLGVAPPSKLVTILESAYSAAIDNLDEFADFEFRMLMPTEEVLIYERVAAVALWCSGFLYGLGESGRSINGLKGDVAEALTDLARVAAMTDDVPEGEENEEDLAEIEEFVRVSVLLIFAETHTRPAH